MLKRTPLKRTPIRKRSKKAKEKIEDRKEISKKDKEIYMEIWREREHVCFESGDNLGEEALTTYFHHVLPKEKSKFPQYRHTKWNIILLSPRIHNTLEFGGMNKTPKVRMLYYKLLEKHYQIEQENGK